MAETLAEECMAAVDQMPIRPGNYTEQDLRRLLSLAWSSGYGAGLAFGKQTHEQFVANLQVRLDRRAATLTGRSEAG